MEAAAGVVIVGAGHGGGNMVAMLRQFGYAEEIVLIGDESVLPYHRPPLSKAFLKETQLLETLYLRPEKFYHDQKVIVRLGAIATAIDPIGKTLTLGDGEQIPYSSLVLATGALPRRLVMPGSQLRNIHVLRTVTDATSLKAAIQLGKRVAIIGGGYIGLELAASTIALGGTPVVIEREERVLARVASPQLSAFFHQYHSQRGVEVLVAAAVQGFTGDVETGVTGVSLSDGRVIPCDLAIVGVGAVPSDALARQAGLECSSGIVVDLEARTSNPDIFAVGDVTVRPLSHYAHRMFRLESVPNALEQAKQAAAAILGKPAPVPEVPWFWSDQFDVKLQIAGLAFDADQTVVRGSVQAGKFAVFHLAGHRLVCVEAVHSPQEFMGGKVLVASGAPVDPAKLADPAVSMKEVVN